MRAYVATTDWDWFSFLSDLEGRQSVEEVNFWQPNPWGGAFGVLSRGEPLLFKLKSPHNAIAGGGFFAHYTTMPMSLAWSAFGVFNGAESENAVRDRITRLRGQQGPWWEDFDIGCILLSEPFFWPKELWIPQPRDFSPQIVRGKSYGLQTEIGRELWDQVLERLQATARPANGPEEPDSPQLDLIHAGGYGEETLRRARLGQGTFRIVVTDAYGRRCAVTDERALPALEAAHIRPFSETHVHDIRNGLLLRSDVHRLFDAGYLTVTPDLHVEASNRMKDDFNDGETYLRLHGRTVRVPDTPELKPDAEALRWHNENRFRG